MNEIFDQEIHMSKVECGTQIEQNYAHLYLRQMELHGFPEQFRAANDVH